jgi:hypothetical protein
MFTFRLITVWYCRDTMKILLLYPLITQVWGLEIGTPCALMISERIIINSHLPKFISCRCLPPVVAANSAANAFAILPASGNFCAAPYNPPPTLFWSPELVLMKLSTTTWALYRYLAWGMVDCQSVVPTSIPTLLSDSALPQVRLVFR